MHPLMFHVFVSDNQYSSITYSPWFPIITFSVRMLAWKSRGLSDTPDMVNPSASQLPFLCEGRAVRVWAFLHPVGGKVSAVNLQCHTASLWTLKIE